MLKIEDDSLPDALKRTQVTRMRDTLRDENLDATQGLIGIIQRHGQCLRVE